MYNIHSHYENIHALAKTIIADSTVAYLHPFGSTRVKNIENISIGGNGPLLFCYDQEPIIPIFNDTLFRKARNYRNDVGERKSTILLNTERNSEAKNIILQNFQFKDCYYFFHALAAADWYRGYQYNKDITTVSKRKMLKKYITFNRITGNARSYRSFFIAELHKRNLLDFGHVSYSFDCPEHGSFETGMRDAIKKYNLNETYVDNSIDTIKSIKNQLRIDFTGDYIPNRSQVISALSQCLESFLYVVTETCFWENKEHLTEKIFKPIITKQPFILLGCPNNLNYLKDYGFKTFSNWWSEDYDLIYDPIERIKSVVDIIENICSLSNLDLEVMLNDMSATLEYNYNRFFSQEFINDIWNELETNLKLAVSQL